MVPMLMFRVIADDLTQANAPTYDAIRDMFSVALTRAMASFSPSKMRGISWVGDGPRVTRKINESGGGYVGGGRTSGVRMLGYAGPSIPEILLSPAQYQAFVLAIQDNLRSMMQGTSASAIEAALGTSRVVNVPVSEYSPTQNGPVSFWEHDATLTHTRDRFPQTNALGQVSADQNENPVGPADARVTADNAPNVANPGTLDALKWIAIAFAIGGVIYMVGPVVRTASTAAAARYRRGAQRRELPVR